MKESIALYHPNFQFKASQVSEMLRLQAEANSVMDSQWASSSASVVPYYRASVIEGAEAVQHFGFKWWKATEPDIGQTRMELIDILHFCLSDFIRDNKGEGCPSMDELAKAWVDSLQDPTPISKIGRFAKGAFLELNTAIRIGSLSLYQLIDLAPLSFIDLVEQLVFVTIKEGSTSPHHLILLFEKLDMEPAEVFGLYVGKNALNKFRTANGQLTNEYTKIWNGREDNEYLTDYILENRKNAEAVSFDAIYNFLSATYARLT